jgi:ribose transport system substrate-binding protein
VACCVRQFLGARSEADGVAEPTTAGLGRPTRIEGELMRRTHRRGAMAVIAALAICGLAVSACSSSKAKTGSTGTTGAGATGDKHYTVGFSNPTAAQPILQTFQKALTAAGARMNITVKSLDAQLDPNKQVSDVDQFVTEHVNAIIVFPLSQDSLTPALNRAHQAGIKVLGFNAILQPGTTNIAPYDADFDQGEDVQGAQLLADYVGTQLAGKGNVIGVGIGVPVPSLQFMVNNYKQNLASKNAGVTWLSTVSNPTDDIAGGQKAVADALTKYKGNIQAVMAYNDDSAIGAAVAFKNAGVKNPIIVGTNGDPQGVEAINDGRMSAMVDIVPWREAMVGITMVKRMLDGLSVPSWIATPVELYTKANIGTRLDWDAAVSQISAGTLSCASGGGCPAGLSGS